MWITYHHGGTKDLNIFTIAISWASLIFYCSYFISNYDDGNSAKVTTFVDLREHSGDILERIGAEQIENQNICVGISETICWKWKIHKLNYLIRILNWLSGCWRNMEGIIFKKYCYLVLANKWLAPGFR